MGCNSSSETPSDVGDPPRLKMTRDPTYVYAPATSLSTSNLKSTQPKDVINSSSNNIAGAETDIAPKLIPDRSLLGGRSKKLSGSLSNHDRNASLLGERTDIEGRNRVSSRYASLLLARQESKQQATVNDIESTYDSSPQAANIKTSKREAPNLEGIRYS